MTKKKQITIQDLSDALLLVAPSKHEKVLERFIFDYGSTVFGLQLKRIKEGLFYVNMIFKLGNNEDYKNPLHQYRLTTEEINAIIKIVTQS